MLNAQSFEIKIGEYAECVLNDERFSLKWGGINNIICFNGFFGKVEENSIGLEDRTLHTFFYHPKTGEKTMEVFINTNEIVSITYESERLEAFKALIENPNRPPVALNWTFEDLMPLKKYEYVEYQGDVLYLQGVFPEGVLATCIKRGQITEHREYRYNENNWFLYDSSKIGETEAVIRASRLNPDLKGVHAVEWKPMY